MDIVCAQGGEGGGHTGEISGNILVPACVDIARRDQPPMLRGEPGMVVAVGGIFDGMGLAAALMMGAVGVWVEAMKNVKIYQSKVKNKRNFFVRSCFE